MLDLLSTFTFVSNTSSRNETAIRTLFTLQRICACNTDAWNEAAATALMILCRYKAAEHYYKLLAGSRNLLPERTVLTAGFCSWPFATPLPVTTSKEVLGNACIGAAFRGDESFLIARYKSGDTAVEKLYYDQNCAAAAARTGHIHILKYLHDNEFDLIGGNCLLEAVNWNQYDTAQFLLESGALPDVVNVYGYSPAGAASEKGFVDMLQLFNRNTAVLWTNLTPTGELRIKSATKKKDID